MEENSTCCFILILEENQRHANLIESVFTETGRPYQLAIVRDGRQAMDFLHQRGEFTDTPRPHLILLDLNLPGKDGREVLAEIKADAKLRRIPIVVLTACTDKTDILKSYALQGNSYVIKADDSCQLAAIVKRIEEFWLGIVTLPLE
ncbi:response regulator [Thermocoleostomius sinensis]|jgi:chemotaxis family two-component system response regulator Rcp1|uniref:Response regulator n=1 Tax=Thermocoleostomius sinensis A174 TaxID=2016057 RepID=A0A9E8ZCQ5_9CYAN|nr:response regulator [Thermocoleostomius sinensis]WAL60850.1 response regulator [Thermocoleostomius sinensis A174]